MHTTQCTNMQAQNAMVLCKAVVDDLFWRVITIIEFVVELICLTVILRVVHHVPHTNFFARSIHSMHNITRLLNLYC